MIMTLIASFIPAWILATLASVGAVVLMMFLSRAFNKKAAAAVAAPDGTATQRPSFKKEDWIRILVVGALVWLSTCFGSYNLGLAIMAFVLMALVLAEVVSWFKSNATEWKELILFAPLLYLIWTVFGKASTGIAERGFLTETNQYISNAGAFWHSVFMVIPWVALVACATCALGTVLLAKDSKARSIVALVALIVAAGAVVSMIIWDVSWGKLFEEEPATVEAPSIPVKETVPTPAPIPEPTPTPEPAEEVAADWWHFYNTELLSDDDPKNDYDFGSFLLATMAMDSIKSGNYTLEDLVNKSIDELIGLVSAEELHKAFWDRLTKDPALGAATAAWLDVKAGTRYLGEFYESCKKEWATTMNAAKVTWMQDQDAYYRTLAAMSKFLLTSAKSVEIIQVKGGLEDQMYMNPYTVDLVPDIIVMESAEQKGYFLRYTLDIKGKEIFVDFRVDCGFQPTNVAKLMRIVPQKNPNKPTPKKDTGKSSGGKKDTGKTSGGNTGKTSGGKTDGKTSGGTTDTGYSSGGGGYTPVVLEPKNPNTQGLPKADVVNDVTGPGPNTNNGVGAVESKAEKVGDSYYMVQQQYEKALEELVTVDESQRVGGDPNTITAPVSSDTELVVNAVANEFGGIDDKMPVADTHLEGINESVGGTNSVEDDPLGDEMDCPD